MPDPDSSSWTASIILLIVFLCVNALLVLCEVAVVSLNGGRLQRMAQEGDRRAKGLERLKNDSARFLPAIQTGITLSSLLAAAAAADRFTGGMAAALGFLRVSPETLHIISLAVVTVLLSFFVLIFAEFVPKRIASLYPEEIALHFSGAAVLLFRLFRPLSALLTLCARGVLRLCGIRPGHEPERMTEEEIRMMVDKGNERGVIEQTEKDMIDNIFEFDDRTATDVMTHRTELFAAGAEETVGDILSEAIERGFSRVPVYEEDVDNIVGILYVKDMLSLLGREDYSSVSLRSIMRPALYVPESNRCSELLRQFKEQKVQMAIVVDEYGGTSGVVTMEDLLESIVGNIQDEYDNEEEEIQKVCDTIYNFDGAVSLDEVEKLMDIRFGEEEDYDTLGGLIIDRLGRIPSERERPSVQIGDVVFSVLSVEDRRIAKVQAERVPLSTEELPEPLEEHKPKFA